MDKKLSAERDPVGVAYVKGSKVYRDIHGEFQAYFSDILKQAPIRSLLGKRLVPTQVSRSTRDALTLEHPLLAPANYAYEWPLRMLQAAALLTLDIALELLPAQTVLKDATPWNILFDGPRPLWVDFTSLMPQEEDLLWVAYDQYLRTFLFPLLLGYYFGGRMTRALLLSSQNGVAPQEISKVLPGSAKLKFSWLNSRLYLPKFMVDLARKSGQEKDLAKRLSQKAAITPQARKAFFDGLRKDTLCLAFTSARSDWSKYYEDINTFFEPGQFTAKQKRVAAILDQCKPRTVVDIGCNQGGYAILAAQRGARVTAFDYDEDSVGLLYQLAREKDLSILPLVGDVLYPSPQSGWRGVEFPAAPQRFRSEMALALALTHHLAITQVQTFERIVLTLSEYAEKWLLTEFVPIEDSHSQELLLTCRRDMGWYTLEHFLDALKKEFRQVTTYPSHPTGRTLCLCKR